MKIIHLVENLDDQYGGPAKSITYLSVYLRMLGINNKILSVKIYEKEHNTVAAEHGLIWHAFDYQFAQKLRISLPLYNYLKEEITGEREILHVHNSWNFIPFIGLFFRKTRKTPLVVSVRGSMYKWSLRRNRYIKKLFWFLFQKQVLNSASVVHVTEPGEMAAVRALGITSPIAVIPNGVDISEIYSKRKRMERYFDDQFNGKRVCLFVSRVHPKKGLEYLVKSYGQILSKKDDWVLVVAGPIEDENYYKKVVRLAESLDISNQIYFTGFVEGKTKSDLYNKADLFVLPSHTENFGVAIAEALAYNLPVITTKGTPWSEIEEYDCGWYIELNQINLTKALDEAFSLDPEVLLRKGKNSDHFIFKYDWKFQAQKFGEVYNYLIDGEKQPDCLQLR